MQGMIHPGQHFAASAYAGPQGHNTTDVHPTVGIIGPNGPSIHGSMIPPSIVVTTHAANKPAMQVPTSRNLPICKL